MIWLADHGLGICRDPTPADLYGEKYWKEYKRRDATEMGRLLTDARIRFVGRMVPHIHLDEFVDIGIGGGRFVAETGVLGYDINPFALGWLAQLGRFANVTQQPRDVMTFWDSLEHMVESGHILANCREWAFVSTPIYLGYDDCLQSPHFKPGEHVLYFTNAGLTWFMAHHGFELAAYDNFETRLGRRSIMSYAFRRIKRGPD